MEKNVERMCRPFLRNGRETSLSGRVKTPAIVDTIK
jgi:hypothetical protein